MRLRQFLIASALLASSLIGKAQAQTWLGFDRNDYPGDESLKALRATFAFSGYWLNNPPGEKSNNWIGKRRVIESAGFGFLLLFNGRLYSELKGAGKAGRLGRADAQAAVSAAQGEGFPAQAIIFLDQEQGGRMLPEQKAYIYAWVDGVTASGYRAGIYCSGIAFEESPGVSVITAEDIRQNAGGRQIVYFVTNDACPPSPGCAFPVHPPSPMESGIRFAEAWQLAQSPQRPDVAGRCGGYSKDKECYPPGLSASQRLHVDVDSATSADPSQARER